jgi:hypothetical protein
MIRRQSLSIICQSAVKKPSIEQAGLTRSLDKGAVPKVIKNEFLTADRVA